MVKEIKHNVFGSYYIIRFGTAKELKLEDQFSGDTDFHTKVIRVRTDTDETNDPERNRVIIDKTVRHEIFHAVLYETGLIDYCDDETLVQWFEVMFPKLEFILRNLERQTENALASMKQST